MEKLLQKRPFSKLGIYMLAMFWLLGAPFVNGQVIVTGKVTGADTRMGIPGVNVIVKGKARGIVTDVNGNYKLELQSGEEVLVFSFVGYKRQEVAVAGRQIINVELEPEITALKEIVVMGYSDKKKTEIASAVSVVGENKLRDVVSPTLGSMLQGKVSGVQVVNSSGSPGSSAEIRIRGTSTLNGNSEPLYVVDGVISGNGDPGIDPAMIENITILKDAGATGLYGSRANGGVIIITTKKGGTHPLIEFSATTSLLTPDFGKVKMMNGAEYYDALRGLFIDSTGYVDKVRYNNNYPKALRNRNFDWVNEVFSPALATNYNLSASGGTEKLKYYLGGSYYDEKGTFMNTWFRKFSLRSNNSYALSDAVNLQANIDLSRSTGRSYDYMDMYYTFLSSPWDSGYTQTGEPKYVDQKTTGWYSRDKINPIHSINNADYGYQSTSIGINLGLQARLLSWLNFSNTLSLNYYNGLSTSVVNPSIAGPLHNIGSLSRLENFGYGFLNTSLFKFEHTWGAHTLSGLLGSEFSYSYYDYWGASAEGLLPGFRTFNTASRNFKVQGAYGESALESFLSQVNYNYLQKYFLTASYRVDANSKFAPGHKTATFPTLSFAWLLNQEEFLNASKAIDLLKARISYGYTGNEAIDPGKYNALYALNSNYNDQTGAYPAQLPNMSLTWEKTRQINLGFDLNLYKRIEISLDLYSNTTKDLLYIAQQPYSIGYEFRWENAGKILNKGIEFAISSTNIKTQNLTWTTDFNISYNKNEVADIDRAKPRIVSGIEQRLESGLPLHAFYLPVWVGVNPENGNPLWETADGKTTSRYANAVVKYVGSAMPKYYGGFTSSIQYGNLSFSFNISYLGGNYVYNRDRSQFDSDGNEPKMNFVKLLDDESRWEKPGDIATHPRMGSNSFSYYPSTRFLEKGDYLKLRNVMISYDLPKRWTGSHIKGITITLSGDNIFTLTGYKGMDPEATLRITDWSLPGMNDLKYPLNHQYNLSIRVKI